MRLRSQRVVTPAGVIAGEVAIRDGAIASVGPARGPAHDLVDFGNQWILPGLIDVHVHGGGGAQVNGGDPAAVAAVARFHARHGTTGLLATTVSAGVEELEASLGAIAACAGRGGVDGGAEVLGGHLEGPFVSPARPGAMDAMTFRAPDRELLARLLDAGPVRVMTLAPELPGAMELVRALAARGAVASLGHSDADAAQARAAIAAGARSATHVFNAMGPLHHREPGILGAVLDAPEVACELICDGVHVAPESMRLVLAAKGAGGVVLVTDAIAAAGMPDGSYRLGTRSVHVVGGRATLPGSDVLAGSTLTIDAAVRGAVRLLGVSVEVAAVMASGNPARLLGLAGRKGAIAIGMDADVTVLDEGLRASATLVGGEWAYRAAVPEA
jgi:N-acetylglucosamine-6-phosphate deacetylase